MNGTDAAAAFRAIADRLDKNASEEFGGAFLLVPPGEGVGAIDGMLVTTAPNAVTFWSGLQGQVELAIDSFKQEAQARGGQGRGFR
jgi:hypothetical protein